MNKSAVAGLEVEDLYRLLRGACVLIPPFVLHPTPTQKCCHAPTVTISKLPPQQPKEAVPVFSTPVVEEVKQVLEAPSSAVSQALEVAISAHMAAIHLQLGPSRRCTNARLRVAVRSHQPHMLLSVCICAETIWG